MFSRIITISALSLTLSAFAPSSYADETAPAATPAPATASENKIADPAQVNPELFKAVSSYMQAWQASELEKMHPLEDWRGGEKLEGFRYTQYFNPNFKIYEWKVTRIYPEQNGEQRVLVFMRHTPPPQIQAYLPDPNQGVRSTLAQYWTKTEDGSYKHLFHIEKEHARGSVKLPDLPNPSGSLPGDESKAVGK